MSDNLFDGLQDKAFDVITLTMGYPATWSPSIGGPTQTGTVLFNNPTESRKTSDVEYNPYENRMEYKRGVFPGLMESVKAGVDEFVTVKSIEYVVLDVVPIYDGNTLIAKIEVKT